MKKTLQNLILSGTFTIATAATAIAQPTLTAASTNPTIGDGFLLRAAAYVAPGPNGANQTWDFSNLTATSSDSVIFVDKANTPNGSSLSAVNIAVKTGNNYQYIEQSSTKSQVHGVKTASPNVFMTYTDPAEYMRFPFTFNDNFTDSFRGTFTAGGVLNHRRGTILNHADGHGTLITPAGTFTNVLRVRSFENIIDSTSFMGIPVLKNSSIETFDWYVPGVRYPVLRITEMITQAGTTQIQSLLYMDQVTVGTNQNLETSLNLQLYPNPSASKATLNYELKKPEQVKITLLNMLGQEVSVLYDEQQEAGAKSKIVSLEKYPKGTYFIQLQLSDEVISKRLLIQ